MNHEAFDTDVLVVGSGPMGATTALALATYGTRVRVVSRHNWTANTPRAHITNQRAMEVLRDLGMEEEARRDGTPWEWMGDMLFTTSLAGPEIARLRTWGTGDDRKSDYLQGSPCALLDLTQSKMEPLLVKNAAARGAVFSFNTEYLAHRQDEGGVSVELRDRTDGRTYTLRARYLVGADGAWSKVLEDAGLKLEGQLGRAATAYITFEADLTRYVAHRPSVLYWIITSDASFGEIGMGLLRAVEPWNQWIAGWGLDISQGEPELAEAEVRRKIRTLVGDPDLKFEVKNTSIWYVNQAHAPVYSSGRVFCGGDAVHRHPPTSGLGSNTCIQDAFNLAWKLAFVIQGHAGERLLDSYSVERAPVGAQVVARANQSRLDYGPLNKSFRDPQAADPVSAGLTMLADHGPEGVARRAAMAAGLKGKSYEFNAQGVELNQRYTSTAIQPAADESPEVWRRDMALHLQATTRPGAKLPHAWLVGRDGRRISTLDLVGKGKFSLVTGLAGQTWVQASEALALPFLRAVVIGAPGALDSYCAWHEIREIEEDGALLVRPDGFVAWREREAARDVHEATHALREALAGLLNWSSTQPPGSERQTVETAPVRKELVGERT